MNIQVSLLKVKANVSRYSTQIGYNYNVVNVRTREKL